MVDRNEKLNRKRQQNEGDEPKEMRQEAKRLKEEPIEEAPAASTPTTKITDLNNDCLEHIFNHLKFADLFNVADSNKHLVAAVGQVFWRKYRKIPVDLYTCVANDAYFKLTPNCIWLYDRTAALKFLRNFGHVITDLRITCFRTNDAYFTELHRYVFEYCSETLIDISFSYMNGCVFSSIEKSFPNIQSVNFNYGRMNENLCQINKWFPNVRHLNFGSFVKLDDRKCIQAHYQHLQSLTVERFNSQNQIGFEETNVMEALRLNPNLQHLKVKNFPTKFLRKISKYMQRVENLEITLRSGDINHRGPLIRLENVKKLLIHMESEQQYGFMNLPFTFSHVEELRYVTDSSWKSFYLQWNAFFSKNPLRKVHFKACKLGRNAPLTIKNDILTKDLPLVTELILENCRISINEATGFLNECRFLTKFGFNFTSLHEYEMLLKLLGTVTEWHGNFDESNRYVELERLMIKQK
ncbi:uncharacterized protein LOC129568915 [Sitodiplosis mosellana]|uniref:uncharacterized protein LOC129568915 n=1 Tax=Sitodiplosis mosellana TaxID=263140 RepID=UPI002443B076|nr:uncharacterized protein LOC129568915 [Sitodiplosis mosellana]